MLPKSGPDVDEAPQVWFPAAPPRQSHPNSCGLYSMTFLFHDLHVNVSGRREKKDNLAVILTYCTLECAYMNLDMHTCTLSPKRAVRSVL